MKQPLKKQLTAQFYRGNRLLFALAALVALASGSLNLILSWLIQQLIDAASGTPDALSLPVLARLIGAFLVLCAVLSGGKAVFEPRFLARAMRQYRDFAFQKLTEKGISSFRDEGTAAYLSALTNDAATIENDYLAQQLTLLTKAVTFLGALLLMLWYSPLLTAIAVGVTVLPFAASLLTGSRLSAAEKRVSDSNRAFTAALSDCLGGFTVVKTFRAEKEIFRLFSAENHALEQEKLSRRRLKALVGMIGSMAGIVAQLGVFLAGVWLALAGRGLTAGAVILFVNLMNFMIDPIAQLPTLLAGRRAALGLIDKLAQALEKDPAARGSIRCSAVRHGIRLEDVSFGYEEGQEVLHHVSAFFAAGKAYAVVGGSGSGKSTLLQLLMGGRSDYRGRILLDENELREISPESLYGMLSVIQQNVFVFNASIRDNVSLFRAFPQEELERAIRQAHLEELLAARGENALCGENGCCLSGGEKQRVSIARSLLKKSSVLLADEATSALDAQTASQVSHDILALGGVTRVVVTHTLEEASLRCYDGILVLKNGALAESGSFDELMAQKGYFYALFTVAQ